VLILKKVLLASLFCPGEARKTFQIISRTFQDLKTKFKDFPGQKKNLGLIQDDGNPELKKTTGKLENGQLLMGSDSSTI